MKRYFIYCLFLLVSCMPEEELPMQDVGEIPEYFIECYCVPGEMFVLSATQVIPIADKIAASYPPEMSVSIRAEKEIPLLHTLYAPEGSEFIYNYGTPTCFTRTIGLDSLYLKIRTAEGEEIHASTFIPDDIQIDSWKLKDNQLDVSFYTSAEAIQNYYILTAEILKQNQIVDKTVCYLDYSLRRNFQMIQKTLLLPESADDAEILLTLKRITPENYDYQISLNGANTANQSSITTPVPLKGNLHGALGIFTCYTEDQVKIQNFH